jgi:hypothetical protein
MATPRVSLRQMRKTHISGRQITAALSPSDKATREEQIARATFSLALTGTGAGDDPAPRICDPAVTIRFVPNEKCAARHHEGGRMSDFNGSVSVRATVPVRFRLVWV